MTLTGRTGGGTLMTIVTTVVSVESMDGYRVQGMEEGMSLAVGPCDALPA